ncbi:AroM family protein [Paenibacillus kribbensis]|uniref:AroM family protein n=1 Tax=Paenibacillus TaxID=44249 RepID=UPI00024EF718|nr:MULTISPECIES: AroM family protein [Paenibacillus]EHS58358.1 protein aroM [Paenibacillus sp. Aloe-11]MEC0233490.1 AroM family protein [Paenibacillus kribbensis]
MKQRQGFRMSKLGMITIGQAPRSDVAPIVERALEGRAELVQAGALDGLSSDYIQQHLSPSPGEYVLTSRLTTGESVVISREKIQPLLQDKITRMEEQGIRTILLLCTGVFPGLHTRTAFLIEPDHVLPPVLKAMSSGRRLGLIGPLEEQRDNLKLKFTPYGLNPQFAAASPYSGSMEEFRQAAGQFKDQADLIVLDCMGYTETHRELVTRYAGVPVILSNALIGKLVSEMV